MLNSRQVDEYFREEAVLIGDRDVMPFALAFRLNQTVDREMIADYMCNHKKKDEFFCLFGDFETVCHAICFTYEGFRFYISCVNALELGQGLQVTKNQKSEGKVIDICNILETSAERNKEKGRKIT